MIEPLAETVRASDQEKGIQINVRTHKIALYADDVLLFMKDPSKSIPGLMKIIDEFSTF